ncbi:Putative sulfate transporter [Vanrija pseudolonga]|uniref:Sulfate transporter n=1 Tax=Vanrija pseudolonga TaxID=143232 RepID=A0AAF0YBC8_9TREE|nr:Putative sulfate transporter [Vanrija pseudolonga]
MSTEPNSSRPLTPTLSSGLGTPTESSFIFRTIAGTGSSTPAPDAPTSRAAMTATPVPNERTRLITYGESQGDGFGGAHHQHSVVGLGDHDDPDTDDTHLQVGGHHHHDGAPDDPNNPGSGRGRLGTTKAVAKKIRQRSKYYVPVTAWLPEYSWALFAGDVSAGVSVACLLIPQAMSYANGLAHLPPVAGLWASAIPALVYGALGTCRQMSMGPEASLSLLMGNTINELVHSDPHSTPENADLEAIAISVITTFMAGAMTTILGLLRLGFLDVVLSRALLRGFLTAIGCIIMIEQLVPLLGLAPVLRAHDDPPTLPLSKLVFILKHIRQANIPTTILSVCCISFLLGSRIIKRRLVKRPGGAWLRYIPEILICVVTVTVLTQVFRWDLLGVDILGKLKGGKEFPFGLPLYPRSLKYVNETFSTAFVMAVVGVVDSMVAAKENSTKYGYPVSPNRELVALGSANLVASCITLTGTVPIFGSLTRSRLNGQIGARTQMASMITAILLILAALFLLPYLWFLPRAVLASVITLVVYSLLDEAPHDIIFFWKMKAWTDFLQMTGTFLLTLLFSIEVGVVASVCFSLLLVIQRSTQPRIKIIGRRPDSDDWVPIDDDDEAREEIPGVLVVRIREPLSFANTGQLKERLRRLELYGPKKIHPSEAPRRSEAKAVILHMGDVDDIDASALQIIGELVQSYHERGVGIYFAHLRQHQLDKFRLVGITDLLGPHHFHPDLRSAMMEIESLGYSNTTRSRYV